MLLVSTSQGTVGRDVAALVGASLLNLVDAVIREQGSLPLNRRRGALVVVDEMQSMPGVDYESMLSELGKFGASFVLATQSLAKLDDLSRTMRDTLLANVGCLAVFQVAGNDARTLVWELGKDRVTEDDITSLPVHHCYVRATVGKERMPAFSMMVRKPEDGDPETAARIREAATAYTVSARQADYADADGHRKVGRLPQGRRGPRKRQAGRGGGGMRPEGCEADLLRALAWMPFLDRQEMVAVSGWSRAAVYEAVQKLEAGGICASVLHAVDPFPPARRFHLTAAGLRRLAGEENTPLDALLRSRPVSAQWRRGLMERLDALAAVYHLACLLSNVAFPIRFRWYRAVRLDAAVALPDGKTVGIVRQGRTADRSGFAKRLWRLRDEPMPGAVLVLMADDVRLRHARRLLSTTEAPALFALEREAVLAEAGDRIWSPPRVGASVDLRYVLDRTDPGGALPVEGRAAARLGSRRHPRQRGGVGHGRPPAARLSEARREARPRPGVRLALDHPHGLGRAAGRLGPEGLPAGQPAGGLPPRHPAPPRGPTPGPDRPGADAPGPQGPHVGRRGEAAVERRSRRRRRPLRVAQPHRPAQPPAAQEHRAHRRRPRLPGRAHRAGPPAGRVELGDLPAQQGLPPLQARRRDARRQPRRLRRPHQGRHALALLPGVGAKGRAALHHVGAARPLSALLLVAPARRRPRHAAFRPGRLRRRDRPHPLPARGAGGDAGGGGHRAPVGLPQGGHRRSRTAGTRLAHPPRVGVAPGPAAPMNQGTTAGA